MKSTKMDERILVCVYYGPNGERLITRGCKLADMLECPLYILTIDPNPKDDWDIEKIHYVTRWKQLADEHGAEFIIKYNEKRPVAKVIGEVVRQKGITQVVIGQTAKSRWEEITKGSFINTLLNEIPYVDLHIVSISRELKNREGFYEKGIRAFIVRDDKGYKLCFNHTNNDMNWHAGIFYKEVGTDFNNGIFKFIKGDREIEVHVVDDYAKENIDEL